MTRRSLRWLVLAAVGSGGVLSAQDPATAASKPLLAWIDAATAEAVESGMQEALARLRPEDRDGYLRGVGGALYGGRPACLHGAQRRRCVEAHIPVLAAHAPAGAALVEYFAMAATHFLSKGNDCAAALRVLDAIEALVPQATAYAFPRRLRRIDCLTELQQLGEADRICALAEAGELAPLERAQVLGLRGSINLMLGRIDLAGRSLTRADEIVAGIVATSDSERDLVRMVEFDAHLRHLDLLAVREQYDTVEAAIAGFAARREQAGRPLSPEQHLTARTHAVSAAYLATQLQPARLDAAVDAIERLLATPGLPPRSAEMASVWLADLELHRGRLEPAKAALQRVADPSATRRTRWLSTAIASELARRTGGPAAVLLEHERLLRAILGEMIAEWRQVAWDRETTGFLRFGSRLRVLAELIAVTTQLHGPERALGCVLDVQCCTTVSRARDARALSVAELREQALPEGHGALVFVPAWNESHVFAFDRSGLVHDVLPRASELREQVRSLRLALLELDVETATGPALAAVRAASRTLSASLLPAVVRERLATWQHLTITGGSLLGNPCFECLEWEPDTLLGERFGVATTASLPLLAALRRSAGAPAAAGQLSARLVATLTPDAAFAARNGLAGAVELAGPRWERLDAGLPGDAERRVGRAATLAAWSAGCRTRRDLTVLLGHGEQPADGLPPALGLTPDGEHPDGLLTPEGIRATTQHGLVVLAACYGARGALRMGDDDVASTLAGAFLFAGADAVIASPAPLRLSMHLDVGAELVAGLVAGCDAAEALRRARIAAAAGDRAQAYRAAQIGLVGWGATPLVASPSRSFSAWYFVAAAALATGLVLLGWIPSRRWWGRAPGSR